MLVFRETNDKVNVIHLVLGPESEFQLDLSGHLVIPLSDKIDPAKQNILYLNRCDSEENLASEIDYYSTKVASMSAVNQMIEPPPSLHQPLQSPVTHQAPPIIKDSIVQNHPKYGIFYKELKCPKCNSVGCYVKNGDVSNCKCLTCHKIDEGLEHVTPLSLEEKSFFSKITTNKDDKILSVKKLKKNE